MDIQQALEKIRLSPPSFPKEEVACIREHREEAIPVLLEYVKAVTDNEEALPDDYNGHFFAMFLLAEFRVHEAFPHLITYLERDRDFVGFWLGDALTENFGSILASVATTDDIPRIKIVIENTNIDTFQRSAALDALQVLFVEDQYPRNDYFAYLRHLLKTCHENPSFLAIIITTCEDTGAREFLPEIEPLYSAFLVDESFIDWPYVQEKLAVANEEISKEALKRKRGGSFVRDTAQALDWLAYSYEKPKAKNKVGRNEPCPCGSGKKYKKCCGF